MKIVKMTIGNSNKIEFYYRTIDDAMEAYNCFLVGALNVSFKSVKDQYYWVVEEGNDFPSVTFESKEVISQAEFEILAEKKMQETTILENENSEGE